ncbi:hypothetical protein [Butyrivibrio sp. WCE2006]|uniref:hypothetical protein n=1 Tax=Butyrivibrio sp. WCE2006 TaxID=1410611 RepID=UPI0005D256C7|nr:hypothetical protein [Butyrivibrio sp. WCE2006]
MRIDGYDDTYLKKIYPDNVSVPDKTGGEKKHEVASLEGQVSDSSEVASSKDTLVKTPRKNATVGDVKISLGNRDNSLVGLSNLGLAQSSLMRKAVSDMQKDSILHEYQYFVGNGVDKTDTLGDSSKVILNDEDGIVIQK